MNVHPGYALAMAGASSQPLPSPWTEHIAPTGFLYYYNPLTAESTYNRPISLSFAHLGKPTKPKKKKEKPAKKTRIEASVWYRVLTNRGNVFYFNEEKRESTWDVPGDIASAVEAMEKMELEEPTEDPTLGVKRKEREEDDEGRAGKRPKREEDEEMDEEAWQRQLAEEMAEEQADDPMDAEPPEPEPEPIPTMPLEEATRLFKTILQEAQINPMHPWDTTLPLLTSSPEYSRLEHSLPLSSQRDIFEEYCKELIAARKAQGSSTKEKAAVDAKEAYHQLLKDTVTSTRTTYTQFRQQVKKERRFYSFGRDEKEREREFRNYLKELGEQKKNERKKAEEAFVTMLKESKTLRSGPPKKWAEAKKEFQKDSRYDPVGSSTLREELYDAYVKSLGEGSEAVGTSTGASNALQSADTAPAKLDEEEKKRRREKAVREREERVRSEKERTAQQNARSRAGLNQEEAELAFNSLLIDAIRDPTVSFQSALSYLSADPRFTSITQTSTLSQQRLSALFNAHIARLQEKGGSALHTLFGSYAPGLDVRWENLPAEAKASIAGSAAAKRLGLDGRVSLRPPTNTQKDRSRARSDDSMDETGGGGYEYPALRDEFESWQRRRFSEARVAFDAMLAENAFVEFWGRVGKMGLTDQEEKARLGKMVFADEGAAGAANAVEEEEEGEEGEGGGGKRDLQALAKGVDVGEVEKVLKRDKRYIVFDYMPQERERWLTDHLRGLSAPKASVHVG
ncbi:hypothetical protein M408DRAFT_333084 [Serendipita vermifera MAFF 305830]|uniref:WW domain-containing protein n=1 Tax=Serendipita vermifera MAFF 305830 TaxID=933852 RepID=A0A0C2WXL1_SERVB|nr:hypothetical protein M408DRAFT_333084 [Serendipita vermifera MAFF 305830]